MPSRHPRASVTYPAGPSAKIEPLEGFSLSFPGAFSYDQKESEGDVLQVTDEKPGPGAQDHASQDSGHRHYHHHAGECPVEAHRYCARSYEPSGDSDIMKGQSRRKLFFQRPLLFWVRLLVGVIFIAASIDKILHPTAFARMVSNYKILPDAFINATAIVLPWLELVLGSLLVLGLWIPGTVVLANLLFPAFFVSLLFNLARGLDIHCGCFTTNTQGDPLTTWYVFRDAVFLLLGGYLFYGVFLKRGREEGRQQDH
jgi:uncharacterized membrane protein YphA (DoxX/SURF4 family)